MSLTPPFFVVSDTHWFHKNIIKYSNRPENHNFLMVDRWNSVVGPDDVVLHLGDLVFTSNSTAQQMFFDAVATRLNGKKFLILGNHDKKGWIPRYEEAGFKVIDPFMMKYKQWDVSFSHYPTARGEIEKGDNQVRVHGHIHNNGYQDHRTEKKHEGHRYGNVNVSVEEIDYYPQPITKLLDNVVAKMKTKQSYYNVNKTGDKNRHLAAR